MCESMSSGFIFLEYAYYGIIFIYFLSDSLSIGKEFNHIICSEDPKIKKICIWILSYNPKREIRNCSKVNVMEQCSATPVPEEL